MKLLGSVMKSGLAAWLIGALLLIGAAIGLDRHWRAVPWELHSPVTWKAIDRYPTADECLDMVARIQHLGGYTCYNYATHETRPEQ